MGGRASIEPGDTDSVQHLLYRSRHRARLHRANSETFPRDTRVAVTAKEQTEEEFELPTGYEGMLQRRAIHKFRRYRLERLDPSSDRLSRVLLSRLLFERGILDCQRIALQQRDQKTVG